MRPGLLTQVLPLVVGGDRTIRAIEFAAECQNDGTYRAELADSIRLQRFWRPSVARLLGGSRSRYPKHRIGQLVEVTNQSLNAGVDQFLGRAVDFAAGIHKPGNSGERAHIPAPGRKPNASIPVRCAWRAKLPAYS